MDYSTIKQRVKTFILEGEQNDDAFTEVARELFTFQYKNNQAYRKYCRKRRVTPTSVQHFSDIPPVHINAFKEAHLACSSMEEAEAMFMTSGTTNPAKRGKNIHRDLEIYDLSMTSYFKKMMMPDLKKIKMVLLFPTKEDMPNSSLAHYLHLAKEQFGTSASEYVVAKDGVDHERLVGLLQNAQAEDEPIFLLGATFSFIHFLDYCKERGISFNLPKGSRIMDTGGAKGQSREMEESEFKTMMCQLLSLPNDAYGNMYGMTELSSQIYNQEIRQHYLHQPTKTTKKEPDWMRTVIVDPETMQEKPEGEKGIIVHYDLANINSVVGIMTEDVGIKHGDGFYLLGRAEGAEAKGCSLAVEQLIASNRKD
ncbi:long-chain fatty acid--CoA ligase [Aquibacillus sediminis]|uniref:LuxE/PaaK family acyltransferase n=1 Tax=Aquibacillus sediminis TaxID=2574734 RepID=UPI001109D7A2|nr:long-chain fatty acid--CoA ligase [Aquibacillus sediminis]